LVDYVMAYHLAPWFDSIPASLLYQPIPGRPIISSIANHPDKSTNDGRMGDFLAGVRSKLQEKYGYDPLFILPLGGDVNPGAEAQGWGQCLSLLRFSGQYLGKRSTGGLGLGVLEVHR
jgi:hypothetical protein